MSISSESDTCCMTVSLAIRTDSSWGLDKAFSAEMDVIETSAQL